MTQSRNLLQPENQDRAPANTPRMQDAWRPEGRPSKLVANQAGGPAATSTSLLGRMLAVGVGLSVVWGILSAPAQAGRYVLNQSFETIERYFGPYLVETRSWQGNKTWTMRTYSNAGIRQVLPSLPANAQFKILFVDGKAQWIILAPASGSGIPVEDTAWQAFQYDWQAAFNFFDYIFGYRPSSYKPVPGYYGGGHEGFYDERICLGDGVQTAYTRYGFGVGEIQLSYTAACEPF